MFWSSTATAKTVEATNAWIDEKRRYAPGSPIGSGGGGSGHYTQLIYRQVTQIGCGSAGGYVVCRYNKMQQSGQPAY